MQSHEMKILVSVLLMFQIPYSSASPGNYVVSTFGFVCSQELMLHFIWARNCCPDVKKSPCVLTKK